MITLAYLLHIGWIIMALLGAVWATPFVRPDQATREFYIAAGIMTLSIPLLAYARVYLNMQIYLDKSMKDDLGTG